MRVSLFFLVSLISLHVSAQDLTGIWRGHFESENAARLNVPGMEDRYKFEVQIGQDSKQFQGVTYSYHSTTFYGKASCFGSINSQTKKVFLEETKIIEIKSQAGVGACIMTCFLQYSKMGSEEMLEGRYTSMSTVDSTQCGKGTVFLRRVATSDFYKEPFLTEKKAPAEPPTKITPIQPPVAKNKLTPKKEQPKVTPPVAKPTVPTPAAPQKKTTTPKKIKPLKPAPPKKSENFHVVPDDTAVQSPEDITPSIAIPQVLASRTNELVKTISTAANQVTIKIYDNGSVDNDTVSVYVDKKLVISKARLTEKAILVKLNLDHKTAVHELVMVAENLGEIPPNTSLMVVNAGDQEYEVRITSTEQKNAVVLFKYTGAK